MPRRGAGRAGQIVLRRREFRRRLDARQVRASGPGEQPRRSRHLYMQAVRLFRSQKPIIGAIHGAAVGGGLGLAMVPDFRVACPETRFCANFTRLGFHPGFGLTDTLPEVIGKTNAAMMFYTSRRVTGEEALAMGLADVLVPQDQVRAAAQKLAAEIAENAPLALVATRATMRAGLADRVQGRDRARVGRAEPPARDRRLQGRRQGDGRASRAELRRPLSRRRWARRRRRSRRGQR